MHFDYAVGNRKSQTEKIVSDMATIIDRYVEKDPTKFCTYEEFKTAVEAIGKFTSPIRLLKFIVQK